MIKRQFFRNVRNTRSSKFLGLNFHKYFNFKSLYPVPISRAYTIMTPKTEQEWQAILSPAQFRVLRQQGTESPYTGEYTDTPASSKGVYSCAGCNLPLYEALTKFIAHCGWPAFYLAIPGSIKIYRDLSHGMVREEMRCATCDGHLGHIFKGEGYKTPTDERHCVNSISLKLDENATIDKKE